LIITNVDKSQFFVLKLDSVTRGLAYKLQPGRCRVDARKYFFSQTGTASRQAMKVSVVWIVMVAQHGRPLYFRPVVTIFLLSFFLAYSQRSQSGCLPYFHTWCGLSANLECRSKMCCARLTENTGRKS